MSWKIGDVAVCVNTEPIKTQSVLMRRPPLQLGANYLVRNTKQCDECGQHLVDIGLDAENGTKCICGNTVSSKNETWWFAAERFSKQTDPSSI